MKRRSLARAGALAFLAAAFLSLGAGPALADPAGPTNYESTVQEVDPATDVATFVITGGDAFLEVAVIAGHEVRIPGYFSEPYIRIDTDGTVWVNEDSQAFYINEDRYGTTTAPVDADGEGEPRWKRVGSGGEYAWHDHRVHWMSRDVPPAVAGDTRQLVFPWRLPVIVDGTDTLISGELVWVPSKNPVAPMLAGVIALLPLTVRRRWRLAGLAVLIGIAATIAAFIIVAQNNGTPPAARGLPVWLVFPLVALAASGWAITKGRLGSLTPPHLLMIGGLTLAAWAYSTIEVLSMPILPSAVPGSLERLSVAFVLWAGMGVAAMAAATSIRAVRS